MLFSLLLLLIPLLSFCQEKKIVKSGYITFNSGSILEFKNLTIDDQKATYFNEVSKTEMSFSLQSIKTIIDGSGIKIYETAKIVVEKKESTDKALITDGKISDKIKREELVYKSISRIYSNGEKLKSDDLELLLKSNTNVFNKYKKGKSEARLGDILMGGGLGLFIGGGLSNLNNAKNGKEGGSPTILIVGLATSIIGIPIKIGGVRKARRAIEDYNYLYAKPTGFVDKGELKVVASADGVGFKLSF